ncbi:MAG: hypothetical protein M3O94_02750, partial [Actinomycetota bacterium]|nr:hypothetical protein [Actinomycetota bacterium]
MLRDWRWGWARLAALLLIGLGAVGRAVRVGDGRRTGATGATGATTSSPSGSLAGSSATPGGSSA